MARKRGVPLPVIVAVFTIAACCSVTTGTYHYFFGDRFTATVSVCGDTATTCFADWTVDGKPDTGHVKGLKPGQRREGTAFKAYRTDDHTVRADSASPPWQVYVAGLMLLAWLALVAYWVAGLRRRVRELRERGPRTAGSES